jgi:hypothetical protein
MNVPPQLLLYHFQTALLPSEPPTLVRVTLLPLQMESAVAEIEEAAIESVFTLMALLTQIELLQVPSARTK